MSKIPDYPTAQMPIERLFDKGAASLSDIELLSIILGSGNQELNVIELSRQIIKRFKSLEEMAKLDPEELLLIKGIGKTKAARLAAVFQIAKNLLSSKNDEKFSANRPDLIYNHVRKKMSFLDREHFLVLALNPKYEIIHEHLVSIGTEVKTFAEPKEVFKMAIKVNAAHIAVCHNHPSGSVLPSKEDKIMTTRLIESSKILGIELIDHLIIGHNCYYSMREHGDI